jgi:dihydroorotate dehydrogenase
MYKLIRSILFLFPAEAVHYFAMNCLSLAAKIPVIKQLFDFASGIAANPVTAFGIGFDHSVGLAAGFDKNARYLYELRALGFSHVEIGTVTPLAQEGNPKPRLFRLPHDQALINRMGFNNDGVKVISDRLRKYRQATMENTRSPERSRGAFIIGGNIGKNKITPNEEAWKDYEICFRALYDLVDYFVVNVSSPNTPGLRELQEKESLRKILSHLQTINSQNGKMKPILLKIAPDLTPPQVDDVIELAAEISLDGLVVSNTTISRDALSSKSQELATAIGAGGLSGKPLAERSDALIRYISEKSEGTLPIIGSGGVFTASDAKRKLEAGATLVQVWTGFIYEGPAIVKKILRGLK